MAGVSQPESDPVIGLHRFVIVDDPDQVDGLLHVCRGVERLSRFLALPEPSSVFVFGVLFLDIGGILKHDRQQVGSCRAGVNGTAEAVLDQFGQQSAMVYMAVGTDHKIDALRVETEGLIVKPVHTLVALIHTAVDEKS